MNMNHVRKRNINGNIQWSTKTWTIAFHLKFGLSMLLSPKTLDPFVDCVAQHEAHLAAWLHDVAMLTSPSRLILLPFENQIPKYNDFMESKSSWINVFTLANSSRGQNLLPWPSVDSSKEDEIIHLSQHNKGDETSHLGLCSICKVSSPLFVSWGGRQ